MRDYRIADVISGKTMFLSSACLTRMLHFGLELRTTCAVTKRGRAASRGAWPDNAF